MLYLPAKQRRSVALVDLSAAQHMTPLGPEPQMRCFRIKLFLRWKKLNQSPLQINCKSEYIQVDR